MTTSTSDGGAGTGPTGGSGTGPGLIDQFAFGLIITVLFSLALAAFAAGWLVLGVLLTAALLGTSLAEWLIRRRAIRDRRRSR
jgi:hypothetical protein